MYNFAHGSGSGSGSVQWPVTTFTLGPCGTFVPINTTYDH